MIEVVSVLYLEKQPHFISAFNPSKEEIPLSLSEQFKKASEFKGFCSKCHKKAENHLIFQGQFICPDCYIVYESSTVVNIVESKIFEETYKPLGDVIEAITPKEDAKTNTNL